MDRVLRYCPSRPRDISPSASESILAPDGKTRKKIPRSALGNLSSLDHASALIEVKAQDRWRVMIAPEGRLDRRLELAVMELLHVLSAGANEGGVLRRLREGA
jgi:hypothetical protein